MRDLNYSKLVKSSVASLGSLGSYQSMSSEGYMTEKSLSSVNSNELYRSTGNLLPSVIAPNNSFEIIQLITSIGIFSSIDQNHQFFTDMNQKLHSRHFQAGDSIIVQGENSKAMFFLLKGTVSVISDDREIVVAELQSPSFFGEIGLLFDVKRTANVEAITKCVVTVLFRDDFTQLLQKHRSIVPLIEQEGRSRFITLSRQYQNAGKSLDEDVISRLSFLTDKEPVIMRNIRASFNMLSTDTASPKAMVVTSPGETVALQKMSEPSASLVSHMRSRNQSMAPRRASVAVWADESLMKLANQVEQQLKRPEKRLQTIIADSTDSLQTTPVSTSIQDLEDLDLGLFKQLPVDIFQKILNQLDLKSYRQFISTSCNMRKYLFKNGEFKFNLKSQIDFSNLNKKVSDDNSEFLVLNAQVEFLESLMLKNCWYLTDIGINKLFRDKFDKLKVLDISSLWNITDTALEVLSNQTPMVEKLDLSNCRKITDVGVLALLNNLKNLNDISLSYCKNLSEALFSHERWKKIEKINLQRCTNIRDPGFIRWKEIAYHCGLELQSPYAVTHLYLSDCSFLTDEAIIRLADSAPLLSTLSLSFCCSLTSASLEYLVDNCPNLQILDISFCGGAVTDDVLIKIAKSLRNLKYLFLKGCVQVTPVGIHALEEYSTSLIGVNVAQCQQAKPADIKLERLQQLKDIRFDL